LVQEEKYRENKRPVTRDDDDDDNNSDDCNDNSSISDDNTETPAQTSLQTITDFSPVAINVPHNLNENYHTVVCSRNGGYRCAKVVILPLSVRTWNYFISCRVHML
jgi:hypothetical protein